MILYEMQETYPDEYEKVLSPTLSTFLSQMNDGKVKRILLAKSTMISKCKLGLEAIKSEYEPKDLELFDEGYESFEQLSEETSSQCSSDFDFIEKEEIPDDIFLDVGPEAPAAKDGKEGQN
mmetsp:Transcript_22580/g.25946  ORF Transcript_22580/g.25946 Transcript_22580/m.25946 type:complete len:121 (+) Transcript_22580:1430-1792(+)